MKLAIVGNCQRFSVAQAMKAMHNRLEIVEVDAGSLINGLVDLDSSLQGCQLIVSQKDWWTPQFLDPVLEKHKHEVVYCPRIYFEAFHPDLTYVQSRGTCVQSPMHDYNSKIVFFAYLRGLSVEQTLRLFNADIYEALGYFKLWAPSKAVLFHELSALSFPTDPLLSEWSRHGCFMHSSNHPKLLVSCTIARILLERIGLEVNVPHPEDYLMDFLGVHGPAWPIYPEIAATYGLEGHLQFKIPGATPAQFIGLEEFVTGSFEAYEKCPQDEFSTPFISMERFGSLFDQALTKPPAVAATKTHSVTAANSHASQSNPYKGLPPHHFWRKAVELVEPSELDPVVESRFLISRTDKVASAGSCFAQHISKQLQSKGFNYFIAELPPPGISHELAQSRSFGVFSARYGNIYTARQLVQLFDRAYGNFEPVDRYWQGADGQYVDPFRPQIEPDGFQSIDELEQSRETHFVSVRRLFEHLDVFTFTLGLTESWCSVSDGAVFPLAPGVAGGQMDGQSYKFVNFTVGEVVADLKQFLARLSDVNRQAKLILTVSPVPLIATYEDRHVLQATTYSKAVLRVAAETIRRDCHNVDYFPSYEIITGQFNRGRYFEDDLRSVKKEGVEHVMRLFIRHCTDDPRALEDAELASEMSRGLGIICEEERIQASVA